MTPGPAEPYFAHSATAAAQYETLRMAAFGQPLPPEARSGLMLFLRRGMWAWVQALAAVGACETPTRGPSFSPTAPGERQDVIYVLAAMTANTLNRRTP